MTRNKRGGIRLKVVFDPSSNYFCTKCCILKVVGCAAACQEYRKVTGTTKYWFEKDEDSKD